MDDHLTNEELGARLERDVRELHAWATEERNHRVLRVLDLLRRQSELIFALSERCKVQAELLGLRKSDTNGGTET